MSSKVNLQIMAGFIFLTSCGVVDPASLIPSMKESNRPISYVVTDTTVPTTPSIDQGVTSTGTGQAATGLGAGATGTSTVALDHGVAATDLGRPAVDLTKDEEIKISLNNVSDLSSCTSVITPLSCAGQDISFSSSLLANLTGPFSILVNNIFNVSVPYEVYEVSQVSNISATTSDVMDYFFTTFNNEIYFFGYNSAGKAKLMKMNSAETFTQVSNLNGSSSIDHPMVNPIIFNGDLYFSRASGLIRKLAKINPTGTISIVSNINNGATDLSARLNSAIFNGELYFTGIAPGNLTKLFKLTSAGNIVLVSNINPSANDTPWNLTVFNSALYFNTEGGKLHKLSSSGVITLVTDKAVDNAANAKQWESTSSFHVFNNELYFRAYNAAGFAKFHKLNKSGVITQVSDINSGGHDSDFTESFPSFTTFNNKLYFRANNADGFSKLFGLDRNGVINQVSNTLNGNSDKPIHLAVYKNELYFSALSSDGYTKLHKINASGEIGQVSNIGGDLVNDAPTNLTVFNDQLYFRAIAASGKAKIFKLIRK